MNETQTQETATGKIVVEKRIKHVKGKKHTVYAQVSYTSNESRKQRYGTLQYGLEALAS